MTFKWTAPEKVLLVDGANIKGDSLLVWYGSDDSKMPNYDIRRYAETLNLSDFGVFGLAAGKPNQESISRTEQSGWHINIFTVAIAVASLALTALVIWVALKMKDE
ncbi:hypothetical protein SDC9_187863 [bioreactor metagenome]|uniref:Uncharacterized protein n=1 Tax=bioreactor metagenome TaxID=1076179 RepID=A0A645HMZ5_9ZZZZ